MALNELLRRDANAAAFYDSLHPSVRKMVDEHAGEIMLDEELYAVANNAMTENLRAYGDIYDDSDTWPD